MQISLAPEFADTVKGKEAEAIISKCVHCGFCNATCPTYQLLGDELDGPRGRIYLIKQLLEGEPANEQMTVHLDRCLTCRACETTCPSGVEYAKLLAIGHATLNDAHHRGLVDQLRRMVVAKVVGNARVFALLLNFGRVLRRILPASLKSALPVSVTPDHARSIPSWPKPTHKRIMVALAGCVQGSLSPMTNLAAAVVLDKLGISLIEVPGAGCCGALDLHTTNERRAKKSAKALIDKWAHCLAQGINGAGIEGFVMTASGCGVTIKEYPHLFRDEPDYLKKAQAVSEKTFDLCEVIDKELDKQLDKHLDKEATPVFRIPDRSQKVAFHSPCTLHHGQKISGTVEKILQRVGYQLCNVEDAHLCCGSAGAYSIFQPEISNQLRQAKLHALYRDNPSIVCTANVGCQTHLNQMPLNQAPPNRNGNARVECAVRHRVKHWIELLL